jgi:hypothetical protein
MLLLSSTAVTGAPSSQSALNGARDFLEENGALKDLRIEPALEVTETGSIVSNWRMADPPDWTEGYQSRLKERARSGATSARRTLGEIAILCPGLL